ncbi:tyrosine-protein phosphatase, partial [Actinoplanes sp. NPDC051633]|uniref:tyrosine-protein phosphatase n=1 Tax=Actinoplanes sp. NPDC051633 TaxID=3155670 RepID=UPI00343CE52D
VTDTPHTRNVSFSTAYNFRDVGGYPGLDGRTVRWRRLFRTDTIHRLEGADWDTFEALGVKTVIDLRRVNEVEKHGRVRDYEGLTYRNLVLKHVAWEDLERQDDIDRERWMADRYLNFIDEGHEALHGALSVIADPAAAPVVVHCMAGKDRTGVTLALTLALLGVSDKLIAEDYALTTTAMQGLVEYLKVHNPAAVEGNEHMFDSPPGAMLLFLSDLRARHGSVEEYVRSIGVTDEQVAAMRDHLLEDG